MKIYFQRLILKERNAGGCVVLVGCIGYCGQGSEKRDVLLESFSGYRFFFDYISYMFLL